MRAIRLLPFALIQAVLLAGCAVPMEATVPLHNGVEYTPGDAIASSGTNAPRTTQPPIDPEDATPTATPVIFREEVDSMEQPLLRVYKADRLLELYDGERLMARMQIALGFSPQGHKQKEGDGKTPEGSYFICVRNANSRYHLSLGINYPNEVDAKAGLEAGLISEETYDNIAQAQEEGKRPSWSTALGGEIMIHGNGAQRDWTAGCVAISNEDMDYLWEHIPLGTKVEILP